MNLVRTMYAPAEKASELELRRQYNYFSNCSSVKEMVDAISAIVIVVNKERQIVLANKKTLNLLGLDSTLPILGKRPGEVFDCIHSDQTEGGCGTTEACRNCGAVNVILKVICSNQGAHEEANIKVAEGDGFDCLNLMVHGIPYHFEGENFYIITLQDISDSQRRMALERIFFHDIINVSGGLSGLISLLKEDVPEALREDVMFIDQCFKNLLEEIVAQRQLLEAENNHLKVKEETLEANTIIREVKKVYQCHPVSEDKEIDLLLEGEEIFFKSDSILLKRVIGNMLKNALEAEKEGGKVSLGYSLTEDKVITFWVHNSGFIPREIQLQMFQRFFSTKGKGRGLGTYSIKLLGEKYLGGIVDFSSDEEEGTTFWISLSLA